VLKGPSKLSQTQYFCSSSFCYWFIMFPFTPYFIIPLCAWKFFKNGADCWRHCECTLEQWFRDEQNCLTMLLMT